MHPLRSAGPLCLVALTACSHFGFEGISAKHLDCPARDIAVSDVEHRPRDARWLATCRGERFACTATPDSSSCTRAEAPAKPSARAPEPPTPPSAPALPAPTPAEPTPAPEPPATSQPPAAPSDASSSPTGCQYDTQCKGDRVCVAGACVDPPAPPLGEGRDAIPTAPP